MYILVVCASIAKYDVHIPIVLKIIIICIRKPTAKEIVQAPEDKTAVLTFFS